MSTRAVISLTSIVLVAALAAPAPALGLRTESALLPRIAAQQNNPAPTPGCPAQPNANTVAGSQQNGARGNPGATPNRTAQNQTGGNGTAIQNGGGSAAQGRPNVELVLDASGSAAPNRPGISANAAGQANPCGVARPPGK